MRRALVVMVLLAGCDDMSVQPKQKNYSPFVGPAETPAGVAGFREAAPSAPPVTLALLERGQERYRIFCTPCHSELGDGHGMVVRRGFPSPPSYHSAALREQPPLYFYNVITNGQGDMYSFASRAPPNDRWAIVAYIKALQRSQNATPDDLAAAGDGVRP
ncbi:c-type cytochrome [Methylocystis sp. JAN1]|uniref:c-type cytochrome n=1 Tax=Methylocystis sp. JAN1 TaxID=3397211 RepID=UPI003FA2EE43